MSTEVETRICKVSGEELPLEKMKKTYKYGKKYYSHICKSCYNEDRRKKHEENKIKLYLKDDSLKIHRKYKEVSSVKILSIEQFGISPINEDEVFVKLLDYKNAYISNYGRVLIRYGKKYCLKRKTYSADGDIEYQLYKNIYNYDTERWEFRKVAVKAWTLVVQEFIVNYDISNNKYCWHKDDDVMDNYYKHLFPVNKYQYIAIKNKYLEDRNISEKQIFEIINDVKYKPEDWTPTCMKKSICNIGYLGTNDADGYCVNSNAYRRWANMIQRCYYDKVHEYKPYYEPCTVCEEWHNFSNFKVWYDENNIEGKKLDLDKDLLEQGNSVYSPDTCVLVSHYINTVFETRGMKNNIVKKSDGNIYEVFMSLLGKRIDIGIFNSEVEAKKELKKYKEDYIKQLARSSKNKIPDKAYQAMLNWKVEIAD